MRSVLHVVAACLLTVLVSVAADKVLENSVLKEGPSTLPVADKDKILATEAPQKNAPTEEKVENTQKEQAEDATRREQSEVKPNEAKPEAVIRTDQNQNTEDANRKEQMEMKPMKEDEAKPEDVNRKEQPEKMENQKKPSEGMQEDSNRKEENAEPKPQITMEKTDQTKMEPEKLSSAKPAEDQKEQSSKVTYNGVKVLRVVIQNKEQKKMIKQLENRGDINTWSGNGTAVDILIRQDSVFNLLRDKKLVYDVIIDDLQKAIEEENPPIPQDEWSELEGRKGHRMTWQMYHRMADIHGYIDYLTATYPDICSQETIGYSVEGRPLKLLKISSGDSNGRAMWVDSGIHAREWITPASSTYAISQMVENGDGTHGVDWYFLPLVNPDGYEHSHTADRLWRKNRANAQKGPCAGTDLNRNFGYRWGGQGSSQQPCRETYAGTGPFSEPETNAINKFVLSKSRELKAYVSLHSYGQYILYPWGYDRKVPPDYSDLHRVGRAMAQAMRNSGGQIYRVGSAAATLYPASGGSDDWAKGTAKIKYTYTIELRDTGRHGFVLPAQYIQPTAKEAYAALKTLAYEVKQL